MSFYSERTRLTKDFYDFLVWFSFFVCLDKSACKQTCGLNKRVEIFKQLCQSFLSNDLFLEKSKIWRNNATLLLLLFIGLFCFCKFKIFRSIDRERFKKATNFCKYIINKYFSQKYHSYVFSTFCNFTGIGFWYTQSVHPNYSVVFKVTFIQPFFFIFWI